MTIPASPGSFARLTELLRYADDPDPANLMTALQTLVPTYKPLSSN